MPWYSASEAGSRPGEVPLVLLLALMQVAFADCLERLEEALDAAESAFRAEERREVVDAVTVARGAADCVEVPLSPTLVARLHRAEALREYVRGGSQVEMWLAAMRWSDPWLAWDVAGPEHPLSLKLYAVEEERSGLTRILPRIGTGSWRVDGTPTVRAPQTQPFLAQQVDPSGVVLRTYRVEPGGRLALERAKGPNGWVIAGASMGAAAGALYGGAWASRSGYHAAVDANDHDAIRRMHGQTNALTIGALTAAGVSAGLVALGITR